MKLSVDYDCQILCDTCSEVLMTAEETETFDPETLRRKIDVHVSVPQCKCAV